MGHRDPVSAKLADENPFVDLVVAMAPSVGVSLRRGGIHLFFSVETPASSRRLCVVDYSLLRQSGHPDGELVRIDLVGQ